MDEVIRISAAGNTVVPCTLALEFLGYTVSQAMSGGTELWTAQREQVQLKAEDPCLLLGLAYLVELRGQAWQATDDEIDKFMARFYSS